MKMMFFKTRVIATMIMLISLVTCSVLMPSPPRQIQKQVQQPTAIIYSADWCVYCRKAKAFMKKNNIKFIEKKLGNPKDFKELANLAKKLGIDTSLLNVIPIFIIKNKIVIGFNSKEIMCILSNQACSTDFFRVKQEF